MNERHRPPLALRAFIGLLGAGMLLVNATLLISDRAPGVLRRVFGDFARRISDRIDAGSRAGLPDGTPVPQDDFLVHVAIWALAVVLVGLAVWTWRGLVLGAIGVLVCSVLVEAAQGRYSQSRTVERNDLVANGFGVALGSLVVAICYLLWTALASLIAPVSDQPDRR